MLPRLTDLFASSAAYGIGWALLHSLWQALTMLVLTTVLLRFIPTRRSSLRYTVAAISMLLILLSSIVTVVYLTPAAVTPTTTHSIALSNDVWDTEATAVTSWVSTIQNTIQKNIPLIIMAWLVGFLFCCGRLGIGFWYLSSLKAHATGIDGTLRMRLNHWANQLHINRTIALAESVRVHAPMVIGYFKPVILIPVGMCAGLSTEQVEAIFIHELTHIKRHDYLINILQSFIESIFFFNPFVWMLSGIMRREREHCCDDAVLQHNSNPAMYAYALAHLEEIKINNTALALSLAGDKNELLNRIKRIMEKSVKNYTGRERLAPAILLVVGLMCASWLTITADNKKANHASSPERLVQADTSIKKKERSATYSRQKTITFDADGKPHEEVVESFEGDETLRPLATAPDVDVDMSLESIVPPIPDFDMSTFSFAMPPDIMLAPMPLLEDLQPLINFHYRADTLPPIHMQTHDWQAFGEAFEKSFKEKFGDFYEKHQEDFDKIMADMQKHFEGPAMKEWMAQAKDWEAVSQEYARKMEDANDETLRQYESAMRKQEDAMLRMEEKMREAEEKFNQEAFKEHMKNMEVHLKEQEKHLEAVEKNMKGLEEKMKQFEKELRDQLVKDGYLKKGDKITNMHWDDNGDIEINDTMIKEADKPKYEALHKKYFDGKGGGTFRFEE